jgi:hypothetical protein
MKKLGLPTASATPNGASPQQQPQEQETEDGQPITED